MAKDSPDYAEILEKALNSAQNELIEAETSLLEVSARAELARNEVSRLKAAVAALSGEPPTAASEEAAAPEDTPDLIEDPDEWEKERNRKLRERNKELEEIERANNPLYDTKCMGCGQKGVLQNQVIQAPSGVPLQAVVCTSCGNMLIS